MRADPPDDLVAAIEAAFEIEASERAGVTVRVTVGPDRPIPTRLSAARRLAALGPTRYALIMRRERANASLKLRGLQQRPAILPGPCVACGGLGVVSARRDRCADCQGTGGVS